MRKFLFAAGMAAVAGCTTSLETRPVSETGTNGIVGIPYALPALQYDLAVTRTMVACEEGVNGSEVAPDFNVGVVVTPTYVAGERFVADYRQLASWTKTSSFALTTFPNQTLKTVNVAAKDESPEIIGEVAKAAFTAARLYFGVVAPMAPATAGQQPAIWRPKFTCPPALAQIDAMDTALKALTKALKVTTAEFEQYRVAITLGTLSDQDKVKVTALARDMAQKSASIAELQKVIAERKESLSLTETMVLRPGQGASHHVFDFPGVESAAQKKRLDWLTELLGNDVTADEADQYRSKLAVVATSRPLDGAPTSISCGDIGIDEGCSADKAPSWTRYGAAYKPAAVPGIAYRIPRLARMVACAGVDPDGCANGSVKTVVSSDALAPQMGRLAILPFQNGFGANNKLEAEFRADGSLDTVEYGLMDAAAGRDGAATLNAVLDQGLAFEQARLAKKTAGKAEAKAAETEALDDQIAKLKKQKELVELQDALGTRSELAALEAEIARLRALKTIKELQG